MARHRIHSVLRGPKVKASASWFPLIGSRVAQSAKRNTDAAAYKTESAMQLAAVNGAVNFLSRQVGAAELSIETKTDGVWREVTNTDMYPRWASNGRPNKRQSAYEWKQQLVDNLLVTGNGFILFTDEQKGPDGYPQEFTVWPTNLVQIYEDNYRVAPMANYGDPLGMKIYKPYNSLTRDGNIMHILFSARDNHSWGVPPIEEPTQALRGALAADAHSELYFNSGGMPQGLLLCKTNDMSEEKRVQMVQHMENTRSNPDQRHLPMVLEGDWDYIPVSEGASVSQLLDSRKYSYSIASSIFGVLMQFIGTPGETIGFDRAMEKFQYDSTIAPLFRMIQWPLSELLPDGQRVRLGLDYFGDAEPLEKARYYERGIGAGWLKPSEVRAMEGLEPIEGIDEEHSNKMNPLRDRTDDSDSGKDTGHTDFPENRS